MSNNSLINAMGGIQNVMTGGMQNNPIMNIINVFKNGGNIQSAITNAFGNAPMAQQVINMAQNGNGSNLKQMAMEAAKQRGTSVEEIAKQLGIQLPN